MKFAITVSAMKKLPTRNVFVHTMLMAEASSEDEAVGIGYRAALKLYPQRSGWHNYNVCYGSTEEEVFQIDKLQEFIVPEEDSKMKESIEVIISGPNSATALRSRTIEELPDCIERCIRLFSNAEGDCLLFLRVVLEMAASHLGDDLEELSDSCDYNSTEEEITALVKDMNKAASRARMLIIVEDKKREDIKRANKAALNAVVANTPVIPFS